MVAGTGGEPPKPCQVFDLICATSTGGIIAILLGRLGLSCKTAIEVYTELEPVKYGGVRSSRDMWRDILDGQRFSSAGFEAELRKIVSYFTGKDELLVEETPGIIPHKRAKVSNITSLSAEN